MRIIAGKDRGRTISTPDGMNTRPTVDRVRESIMSAVYSSLGGFDDVGVLDLFAGSGALGIESLSRGCKFAVFNDTSAEARNCIERNIRSLGYNDTQAKITSIDALAGGNIPTTEPFKLVFLDPPYETEQTDVYRSVSNLIDKGAIAEDALIVYEHDVAADAQELAEYDFELLKEKKYGKTFVSYFKKP